MTSNSNSNCVLQNYGWIGFILVGLIVICIAYKFLFSGNSQQPSAYVEPAASMMVGGSIMNLLKKMNKKKRKGSKK